MTYEIFSDIITRLQKRHQVVGDIYKLGVDLINFDDDIYSVINCLFDEIYGKEGRDWIDWYLYERRDNEEMQAWDADKKPICYSIESLWEYLEKN